MLAAVVWQIAFSKFPRPPILKIDTFSLLQKPFSFALGSAAGEVLWDHRLQMWGQEHHRRFLIVRAPSKSRGEQAAMQGVKPPSSALQGAKPPSSAQHAMIAASLKL